MLKSCLRSRCLELVSGWQIAGRGRGLKTTSASNPILKNPPTKTPPYQYPLSALSYHWDTLAPMPAQLAHAARFFERRPPAFLWSAARFHAMSFGDSPEVCFLGRSNVGKSSLLNALLGTRIAHTSSKRGRTRLMNAFAVGSPSVDFPAEEKSPERLVVLDMPGYGKGGQAEWGTEILKYISKRKELRCAFLLIDTEHGVKENDRQLLAMFRTHGVPYQVILSKVDKLLFPGSRLPGQAAFESRASELRRIMEGIKEELQPETEDEGGAVGEMIACSSDKWIDGRRIGIDAVRFAMLRAAELELRPQPEVAKPVEIISHEDIWAMTRPST